MASRPRREATLPKVQAKISSMMSSAPGRNPKKAKAEPVASQVAASEESEDSEELLSTPFQERPPSPKKTRPRSASPTKRQPMDVDETHTEEIADQASSVEPTPAIQSTTGDEGLDDLMSKYSNILDEMDTSTKAKSAQPALKKTQSKARLDTLDKLALTAEEEATKAEQRKKRAESAAIMKRKLLTKPTPSIPAPSFASRASRSRGAAAADVDNDESGSVDDSALVTFNEGDVARELEDQMDASDDDDAQYNEEALKQAEAELEKAKARREDLADALKELQSSSLGQKHAKHLLLTQAAAVETAPKALAFLKYEGSAAIDMKGINDSTLPMPMAPVLDTLASAIMHGKFQMWFKYSKRVPSARFLTFLYEVVCLYDGVPENRGDYLLVPFAFDEDLLEKDESYDEEWRQLRLQQVGLVIDGAIDIIRICLSKHTEIWSLNASSLLATLHHFGVSSSISLISTAHLAYDVSEYVPPVEKDSDEESDNDKMNVEDAKQTHKKKRKVKKPRSVESFPERNLQGFLELMTVLIETKSLSITEAQKLVFLSILIRFSTDPLIFGGEHAQGPLVTCMSTLVDDLVSSPDADPYALAVQVANTLIPQHAFAKTRLLVRSIAARLYCRSENGKLFRRVLSFCFAKKLLGQSLDSGSMQSLSPSLENIRDVVVQLKPPPASELDTYWTLRNVMLLLLNSVKYSVTETAKRKSEIKKLEAAFRAFSGSIKEGSNADQGLSLCKELALILSTMFNVFVGTYTKDGMQSLSHMFQNQEAKAARAK